MRKESNSSDDNLTNVSGYNFSFDPLFTVFEALKTFDFLADIIPIIMVNLLIFDVQR